MLFEGGDMKESLVVGVLVAFEVSRWWRRLVALSVIVLAGVVLTGCLNLVPQASPPTAEELCAAAANAFFCGTSTVPQDPTLNANGYHGYCMVGNGGLVGYSGISGTGGATPVVPTTDGAWQLCGASSVTSRGACVSVVRCTHN
jgi:hypothetical protein